MSICLNDVKQVSSKISVSSEVDESPIRTVFADTDKENDENTSWAKPPIKAKFQGLIKEKHCIWFFRHNNPRQKNKGKKETFPNLKKQTENTEPYSRWHLKNRRKTSQGTGEAFSLAADRSFEFAAHRVSPICVKDSCLSLQK